MKICPNCLRVVGSSFAIYCERCGKKLVDDFLFKRNYPEKYKQLLQEMQDEKESV